MRIAGLYGLWFFFYKQKTAYEMRISDWSSDVCSSDLIAGDAPPHRAGAAGDAGAYDAAGDGVRRRHRDAEQAGGKDHDRTAGRGGEPLVVRQLGDAAAHRLDDLPPARQRAKGDGDIAAEGDPVRDVKVAVHIAGRIEQYRDDPHRLMRLVPPVAERERKSV